MVLDGLLKLCASIGSLNSEMFRDRQTAIQWLTGEIQRLVDGVSVEVSMVDLRGGRLPEADHLPVHTAVSPERTPSTCRVLHDLRFLGEPADWKSEDVFLLVVRDGPFTFDDIAVPKGKRLVLCRIRLEFAVLWLQVIGDAVLLPDSEAWSHLLPPALHGFMRMLDFHQRTELRARQQAFFNALLQPSPDQTTDVFDIVCRLWQKFSGANWVWLWLYDEHTKQFELTSAATPKGVDCPEYIPPKNPRPGCSSVAAYVATTNEVVSITDPATWLARHKDRDFRVAISPEYLEKLGGSSFLSIPVCAASSGSVSRATMLHTEVRGALCLHFSDPDKIPNIPYAALRMMGGATAQVIVNTFVKRYGEILLKMNEMARTYLTRVSRRPTEDRRAYLSELIRFIQTDLHFRMISVFWRQPFTNAVECIATTGICMENDKGEAIPPDRWCDVVYQANVGRTGQCFGSGQALVYFPENGKPDGEAGRSFEIDDHGVHRGEPFVLYPIPTGDGSEAKPSLGVLRCVCDAVPGPSSLKRRHMRLELQPLNLIAQQLGPVLQTLESHILREHTISVTKHDLFGPLNMIRDSVGILERDLVHGRSIGEYAIKDLQASVLLAQNLVAQLDPEPTNLASYKPAPRYIEGDILARVVGMLRRLAMVTKSMQIEFENIRTIPQLNIDQDLVERAIVNLLLNAIKYGQRDSTILVKGRRSTAGYCVDVENTGIGIEANEVPFIGRAYYRAPRARKEAMGLGLGISIAKGIMERHGGKLFVTQPKDPTIFSLFFPKSLVVTESGRR